MKQTWLIPLWLGSTIITQASERKCEIKGKENTPPKNGIASLHADYQSKVQAAVLAPLFDSAAFAQGTLATEITSELLKNNGISRIQVKKNKDDISIEGHFYGSIAHGATSSLLLNELVEGTAQRQWLTPVRKHSIWCRSNDHCKCPESGSLQRYCKLDDVAMDLHYVVTPVNKDNASTVTIFSFVLTPEQYMAHLNNFCLKKALAGSQAAVLKKRFS